MYRTHRWNLNLAFLLVAMILATTALAKSDRGRGSSRNARASQGHSQQAPGHAGYRTEGNSWQSHGQSRTDPSAAHDYGVGTRVPISSDYRMRNNTTYVPLRQPFEQMGARVDWNERDNQARVDYQDRTILCTPGSRTVTVIQNGQRHTELWAQAPTFYGGHVYVPVRPAMTSLGVGIGYQNGAVTIGAGFFLGLR